MEFEQDTTLIELAAGITESYVANNQIQPDQVPELLGSIYGRLETLHNGKSATSHGGAQPAELPTPPVKPQNSVRKNDVVCLECGKTYKTLKRHLATEHGFDESTYKERWGLSKGTKLVAKEYSQRRSQMASEIGLGNRRKR